MGLKFDYVEAHFFEPIIEVITNIPFSMMREQSNPGVDPSPPVRAWGTHNRGGSK